MSKYWIMSTSNTLDSKPYFTKGKWYEILELSTSGRAGDFRDDTGDLKRLQSVQHSPIPLP